MSSFPSLLFNFILDDRHRHDEVASKKSRWAPDVYNYDKRSRSPKRAAKDERAIVTIDIDDPVPVPPPAPHLAALSQPVPAPEPEAKQTGDIAKVIAVSFFLWTCVCPSLTHRCDHFFQQFKN